jgi:hypothetical protein
LTLSGTSPSSKPATAAFAVSFGKAIVVGVRGFEPPAPSSRTRCATRLRYTPPRRRSFSPAATCSGALIAAPWRAGKPNGQTACSLCSLKRHQLGTSVRDGLAPADFGPAPCPGTGPMRHTPALRKIKSRSGESCGSSVVEHSLGKGEAESSILSRSTSFPLTFLRAKVTERRPRANVLAIRGSRRVWTRDDPL